MAEANLADWFERFMRGLLADGSRVWWKKIAGGRYQATGLGDYIACLNVRFVWVELKNPDGSGKESRKQRIERLRCQRAGAFALVSSNKDEIRDKLLCILGEGNARLDMFTDKK